MNATPLDDIIAQTPPPANHKKYGMIIGVVAVVALLLGVVGYTLKSQVTTTQTTTTKAALPSCLPGDTIPLPADFDCWKRVDPNEAPPTSLSDNRWIGCGAPAEGYCKKKNVNCAECRDRFDGLRIICGCVPPSPTPPQKTPEVSCPVPNVVTNVTISCPKCAI